MEKIAVDLVILKCHWRKDLEEENSKKCQDKTYLLFYAEVKLYLQLNAN